jgi:hypothetical protein
MLIDMTDDEKRLWEQIVHYWTHDVKEYGGVSEKWRSDKIGQKQRALMNSLLTRGAIPQHRLKWVDDPDFFIGSSKSRFQCFSENFGAADDRVFEHPQWYSVGYLPFFVGVISLPDHVVEEFREDADRRWLNAYEMGLKYRQIAKSLGLPRNKIAEEFHKLALDCGYDAYACRSIRDAIFKHLR